MPATSDTQTQELRDRAAEYIILDRFDTLRRRAGHDYGNGQRVRELRNRRDELIGLGLRDPELDVYGDFGFTAAELRAAFDRVSAPKRARLEAEDYRRATPATRRTLETWTRLAEETATAARRELEAAELDAEAIAELDAGSFRDPVQAAYEAPMKTDAELEEQYAKSGGDETRRDVIALRTVEQAIAKGRYTSNDLEELFSRALAVKRNLDTDTIAPAGLRERARDIVEAIRQLRDPAGARELRTEVDLEAAVESVIAAITTAVPAHGGYGTARREVIRRVAQRFGMEAVDETGDLDRAAAELGLDWPERVSIDEVGGGDA